MPAKNVSRSNQECLAILAARCVAQKYFPLRTPEDTSEKEEGCHIKLLLSDSLHYIIDFYAPIVLTWLRSTTERALQITAPSTPQAAASITPCTPTSKTTNMSGFDAPFDATNP